jgi:hypothetical protein
MSFFKTRKAWPQKSKYGNTRSGSSSSKLEAAVEQILRIQQKAGEIREIQVQASVYLTKARILYKPDFRCVMADGSEIYVEAKGFETPVWRIKLKLYRHYGSAPLHVYKGSYRNPQLDEIVIPKTASE